MKSNKHLVASFLICSFLVTSAALSAQPVLKITYGLTKQDAFRKSSFSVSKSGQWENASGLTMLGTSRQRGEMTEYHLQFESSNDEPHCLDVQLEFSFSSRQAIHFWDGKDEHVLSSSNTDAGRDRLFETFPLIAAYDNAKGYAVALTPNNIVSVLSSEAVFSKNKARITYGTQVVVDQRRAQTLTFVVFPFTAEFSWSNAVQDYYDAYPEAFQPHPGIDQRIYGIGGYHTGSHLSRIFQLHAARHSKLTWEWTYAPWVESGNWYPVGAGWRDETNECRRYYAIRKPKQCTREEFDAVLHHEISMGDRSAAMFYYILVKDIHQNLTRFYPDAVRGGSGLHSLPSNRGKTMAAFAPGSPLFDYLQEQLNLVTRNYEISGFAFDMANGSGDFRTPSQNAFATGRAFDAKGEIYTCDTVLPIPFADYIHTLKRGNKTMGVYMNMALSKFSAFTTFRADGVMFEGTPDLGVEAFVQLRLMSGAKPMTFWGHIPNTSNTGVLRHMAGNRETLDKINAGLFQFTFLKCLKYGISPMNWPMNDFLKPHVPLFEAMKIAGWQAVSAVHCDSDALWIGRFGRGAETIFTVSNPLRHEVTAKLEVVNQYLGSQHYAFLPQDERLVNQSIEKGITSFSLTLPPKGFVVLEAIELSDMQDGLVTVDSRQANQHEVIIKASSKGTISIKGRKRSVYAAYLKETEGLSSIKRSETGFRGDLLSPGIGGDSRRFRLYYEPETLVWAADEKQMTSLFTKESNPLVVTGAEKKVHTIALMLGTYYPYVKACQEYCRKNQSREPGFLNPDYAVSSLDIVYPQQDRSAREACIYVGTLQDFPDLASQLTLEEKQSLNERDGGFLKFIAPGSLWIGGNTPEQVYQAGFFFFQMVDGTL